MKLRGGNLEEVEVEYKLLSEYHFFGDERRQNIVKKLEKLYLELQEKSKKIDVKPFPQNDGKVEILPGMISHKCSNSLESLKGISQYGILASEWFGKIESEREGIFCAFVSRIHQEDGLDDLKKQSFAKQLNLMDLKFGNGKVLLFFDSTNPIFKQLLHLDYFEYEKVKQQSPEKITEMYSEEEIELFDQVIEPFSPYGKVFHVEGMLPRCDWSAIPGGIPSSLVNGICTKSENYDSEYIESVANLFPNATIFNGSLEILHLPKRKDNTQELIRETLQEKDAVLLDDMKQTNEEKETISLRRR